MSDDYEKKDKASTPPMEEEYEKANMEGTTTHHVRPAEGLYDPSKESVWTRLGVTFESFKRAPGTTGLVTFSIFTVIYHHLHSYLCRRHRSHYVVSTLAISPPIDFTRCSSPSQWSRRSW